MSKTNLTIDKLTDDKFDKTFKLVDLILCQYNFEDNDDYVLLILHLITIIQMLKSYGGLAFTTMINNPETYIKKAS